MKTKLIIWTAVICTAMTAGLLSAPNLIIKSIPTAQFVNVEKIDYIESLSLSGTIMRNYRDESFYVQTYVPEQDISKITIGQTVKINGDAFPNKVYSGVVDKISETASKITFGNIQKTAVEVTVKIEDFDEDLKHGYTAKLEMIISEPYQMTIVPYDAVNQDDTGEFVYILKEGKAEKKYIETGAELSSGVELKTLLSDNERIITGDELGENGIYVKILE